jgi:hypothetical protein
MHVNKKGKWKEDLHLASFLVLFLSVSFPVLHSLLSFSRFLSLAQLRYLFGALGGHRPPPFRSATAWRVLKNLNTNGLQAQILGKDSWSQELLFAMRTVECACNLNLVLCNMARNVTWTVFCWPLQLELLLFSYFLNSYCMKVMINGTRCIRRNTASFPNLSIALRILWLNSDLPQAN